MDIEKLLSLVLDEVRGSWRFRLYAMLAVWVVCLIGWAAIFTLPDVYQASARVFVDARTSLSPVTNGIVIQQDVNSQLSLVRQALLSRPVLEKVARETDIDLRAKTTEARAVLIEKLAQRIQLGVFDVGGGGAMYTLAYQDPQRAMSLKVVQLLLNTFIEDTLGGKRVGAEVAQKFLKDQIEEYDQKLHEAEERLAEFKKRNVGLMPGAQGDYFSRLQTTMATVEKAQAELLVAQRRRDELARQLRGEVVQAAANSSGSLGVSTDTSDTAAQIRQAQARLDDLRLKYTDKYPDVVMLQETIAQLEQRRKMELDILRDGKGILPAGATASPVVQSIQLAINQADVEIASLRAQIAGGQDKVVELRKLVNTAPEVEAEFARLNRDYDVVRSQYNALVDRSEKAKLGDQAEATQSIRFEVLDPPTAKSEPVAPNRPLMMVAVLVAGLGVGCALAFLLHKLRPIFSSSRALSEVTGLPVLGTVSHGWAERYRLEKHRDYIKYSTAAAMLLVTFLVMVKFSDTAIRLARHFAG